MRFRVTGLPAENFAQLFSLSDGERAAPSAASPTGAGPGTRAASAIPRRATSCFW